MALNETVEVLNVGELTEFSTDKRVRKKLLQSKRVVSELVCYEPGQGTVLHHHPAQDEVFYIISGSGAVTFEDKEIPISESSLIFVPAGVKHGFRTDEDSRLVVLFAKGPGVTGPSARE